MSFERPNLHFSVQRKQSPLAHNFRPLLDAGQAGRARWWGGPEAGLGAWLAGW